MYEVIKYFRGSPDGCRVLDYQKGQILTEGTDFSKDLIEVALTEKWVVEVQSKPKKKSKKK